MYYLIDHLLTQYYFTLVVPFLSTKPYLGPIFSNSWLLYHKFILTIIIFGLITLNSYILHMFTVYTVIIYPAYHTLSKSNNIVSADELKNSIQNEYLTIYWLTAAILMSFDYIFYSSVFALFRIIFLCILWSNVAIRAELFKELSSRLCS